MNTSIAHPTIRATYPGRLATVLLVGLFSFSASAQVWVTDTEGNIANKAGFAKQLEQSVADYARQAQQLYQETQTALQLVSSVQGLASNMSLLPNQMQQITDASPLIQANCAGSGSGGIVGDLLNQVTSLVNQSIMQRQQQICAAIVQTQVDKYNLTVQMTQRLGGYSDYFNKVEGIINSAKTLGDANSANNEAQKYDSAMNTEMNDFQTQIKAKDAMISSLQDMQSTLAQSTMRGGTSLLGNAVQAAALTTAFTGDQ